MKNIVDKVIKAYGGVKEVQKRFGYSDPMGVYHWRTRGIPRAHIADIYMDTGIAIELLKATSEKETA